MGNVLEKVPVREQDPKVRALLKEREGDTHHGGCGNCGGDK